MTREEAIKLIQNVINQMDKNGYVEIDAFHEDALLMAIKELEQEPILDGLTEIIEPLRHLAFDEMSDVEWQILQVIDKYAEQEPKTGQEKQAESEKYQKAFDDGYENGYAQARFDYEQEPCEDAIRRDAVKELIKCGESTDTYDDVEQVCKWIDALPSVTQKSGEWIVHEKPHGIRYLECPYCNIWYLNEHLIRNSYCPNCGARMIDSQESEDEK